FYTLLQHYGKVPLPPYIDRPADKKDEESYQTIYAIHPGAIAAPTAGLHFTEGVLMKVKEKGVKEAHLTLHVGLGTFKPIQVDDIREHQMHQERFFISEQAAAVINNTSGRVIAVGTTSLRTLESVGKPVQSGSGNTAIYIYPGYQFKVVDVL